MSPSKAYMRYSTVGIEFVLSILFGFWAGRWADGKFHTAPYFALFGGVMGTVAAFRSLWRAAKRAEKDVSDPSPDED